jgi:hypothetical protein
MPRNFYYVAYPRIAEDRSAGSIVIHPLYDPTHTLGMNPNQSGPSERTFVRTPGPFLRVHPPSPIITGPYMVPTPGPPPPNVITPAPQPVEPAPEPPTIITQPVQYISAADAVGASPGVPSPPATGELIPGVPDEYTYIGGGIVLFLLFSSMKGRKRR